MYNVVIFIRSIENFMVFGIVADRLQNIINKVLHKKVL